jgi:hypothetical protein
MNRFACAAVLLAGLYVTGCDDTPAPPPALVQETPPPDAPPTRPTTQELLEGPRKSISLGELPLTVQAPAGWAVKPMFGTSHILLQGPTPTGDAAIQLNERPLTTGAKFDLLVNGAKKELQQFPQSIKLVELRTIEGAKVLERQRIGLMPKPSPDDPPGMKPSPPLNWTITVFVPRGADYDTHELNFVGLTADQYEADKGLLRGIIESIAVNHVATPGGATTAPATP